jgi:hypothetical protein
VAHKEGRWVRFGGANPGGADLIGFTTVTITPDMVGKPVAVFTALEVKAARGRATKHQKAFIENVTQRGGMAGIVRSVDEAKQVLQP